MSDNKDELDKKFDKYAMIWHNIYDEGVANLGLARDTIRKLVTDSLATQERLKIAQEKIEALPTYSVVHHDGTVYKAIVKNDVLALLREGVKNERS